MANPTTHQAQVDVQMDEEAPRDRRKNRGCVQGIETLPPESASDGATSIRLVDPTVVNSQAMTRGGVLRCSSRRRSRRVLPPHLAQEPRERR